MRTMVRFKLNRFFANEHWHSIHLKRAEGKEWNYQNEIIWQRESNKAQSFRHAEYFERMVPSIRRKWEDFVITVCVWYFLILRSVFFLWFEERFDTQSILFFMLWNKNISRKIFFFILSMIKTLTLMHVISNYIKSIQTVDDSDLAIDTHIAHRILCYRPKNTLGQEKFYLMYAHVKSLSIKFQWHPYGDWICDEKSHHQKFIRCAINTLPLLIASVMIFWLKINL